MAPRPTDRGRARPRPSPGGERAVTPVVGVLLLVAIAVVLASVVGVYGVQLGQRANEAAPSAEFDVDYDEGAGELTVTHVNGDVVEATRLSWTVQDGDGASVAVDFTGRVAAGSEATLTGVDAGETVVLRWETAERHRSSALFEWSGPAA